MSEYTDKFLPPFLRQKEQSKSRQPTPYPVSERDTDCANGFDLYVKSTNEKLRVNFVAPSLSPEKIATPPSDIPNHSLFGSGLSPIKNRSALEKQQATTTAKHTQGEIIP